MKMKKNIFLLLFTFFVTINAQSQDSTFVRNIIRDLSAPEMFGRGYSYSGDSLAANYICSLLQNLGTVPLTKDFRQSYGFYAFSMEDNVSLQIGNKELVPYDDYRIAPFSVSLNKKYTIVLITPDFFNDQTKQLQFRRQYGEELKDILLYMDISAKKWQKKANKKFVDQLLGFMHRETTLGGIAGILVGTNEMPVWSLSTTDKRRDFALIYIRSELMKKHTKDLITVSYENKFVFHKTQNVGAMIKGTLFPDSFFVFTAHYDHLGTMGASVIFPGAHDNASGVAFLLDLARHFSSTPPPYSLIFLFFSGEEAGLKGSLYASENPLFDFEKVKLLINLDMQCGGDEGIMVVNTHAENTQQFYQQLVKINEKYGYVAAVKSRPNAANSDHYPFSKFMPSIFIYTLGGKIGAYHHYGDTCESCSLNNYNNRFKLLINLLAP